MSVRARARSTLAACALLLAVTGCDAARSMGKSLGELQDVQAAVAKEAGTPAVQVNLMNGRYLSVGIVNSPVGKLPREEKQAKALELAKVAYRTLPSRSALEKVRVTFVVAERRFLIVNYTNATDGYTFDPGQLADEPAAEPSPTPPSPE